MALTVFVTNMLAHCILLQTVCLHLQTVYMYISANYMYTYLPSTTNFSGNGQTILFYIIASFIAKINVQSTFTDYHGILSFLHTSNIHVLIYWNVRTRGRRQDHRRSMLYLFASLVIKHKKRALFIICIVYLFKFIFG